MITLSGANICMPEPCVLAVGKFECFHLGHMALINELIRLARRNNIHYDTASALIMFNPHPYRVLTDPDYKPLLTGCEREDLARKLGVDYLLEYLFDREFADMPPRDFCRILFEDLKARIVVVGEGYRFGHKRAGTVDILQQMAIEYGAQVHVVEPHRAYDSSSPQADAAKTSTSTIRELLSANKFAEAKRLLGYPFFVLGTVTRGRQLGRTIGFPTINLYPSKEKFLPGDGVYATSIFIGGYRYNGITNIGTRPTIESAGTDRSVETHLFDFKGGELYGQQVRVEFLRFIRPERKFKSLDALKAQIMTDCKYVNK